MTIVSPRSAAAINCEKFWFASLTDISRIPRSCSTLHPVALRTRAQSSLMSTLMNLAEYHSPGDQLTHARDQDGGTRLRCLRHRLPNSFAVISSGTGHDHLSAGGRVPQPGARTQSTPCTAVPASEWLSLP